MSASGARVRAGIRLRIDRTLGSCTRRARSSLFFFFGRYRYGEVGCPSRSADLLVAALHQSVARAGAGQIILYSGIRTDANKGTLAMAATAFHSWGTRCRGACVLADKRALRPTLLSARPTVRLRAPFYSLHSERPLVSRNGDMPIAPANRPRWQRK